MTASGNEPQLGGQDQDNAPMISGRGTKIIADARGAYLAGNLKALLDLLDAERALVVNARARATQWQLEAAWAILHDQPLPPSSCDLG